MHPFQKIGVDKWLQRVCDKIGYEKPTLIQEMAIPSLLENKNVIVNAETGSGKTATFGFPILQQLAKDPYGVFALILTPSRELAMQISEQLHVFGQSINLKCCSLVGGQDMIKQIQELDKIPHIVVGTPGRVLDMLGKSEIFKEYLENVQTLVFDEADRLFEDTLFTDVTEIIECLPEKKQVVLATATINDKFDNETISKYLKQDLKFEKFTQNDQKILVSTLKQKYVFVPKLVKDFYAVHFLKQFESVQIIIFVNKCRQCQFLAEVLTGLGLPAVPLHSFLKQGDRIKNLKNFKNQKVNILVATDVVSRGLDIPFVELVMNYDIPRNQEDYVHRVGRTARKGKRGFACSFVTQDDVNLLLEIEKYTGEKMTEYPIPEEEAMALMEGVQKIKKNIKVKQSENGTDDRYDLEEQVKKNYKKQIKHKKKIQDKNYEKKQQQQKQMNIKND